jgi:hypothetical protein
MGYSNIQGALNVLSDTSTSTLTVRTGATFVNGMTVSGVSNFSNVVASNLTVTNTFIVDGNKHGRVQFREYRQSGNDHSSVREPE